MGSLEYSGLMYADFELKSESGEVYFSIKRKDGWGPAYYVFEKNLEVLSEEEQIDFKEAWSRMTRLAGLIGISLYDSAEIMQAVETQIKKVLTSEDAERAMEKADETGELALVRDIDISLFDHGKGRITSLTIGISVLSGASESIKKALNV